MIEISGSSTSRIDGVDDSVRINTEKCLTSGLLRSPQVNLKVYSDTKIHANEYIHSHSISRKRSRKAASWSFLFLPILLLALLASPVYASQGDRSPEYRNCVDSCDRDSCLVDPLWDDGVAHATKFPWILRVTRWTCIDNCRYHCTHRVTNEAHKRVTKIFDKATQDIEGQASRQDWSKAKQRQLIDHVVRERLSQLRPVQKEMVQYHGKWVFIRVLGAQEPLSVLFSIMNLYVHLRAVNTLQKQISDAFPLKLVYILHALLSCLAWLASAVFHTRDKPVTERLDYFFAGAVVLGGFFYTVCRLFRLGPGSPAFKLLAQVLGAAYLIHILYLSFGRFDYAYNMQANITVAVLHSVLWLAYSFRPDLFTKTSSQGIVSQMRVGPGAASLSGNLSQIHANGGSPPVPVSTPVTLNYSSKKSRRSLQKLIALLWLASSLEVFDFPPIWRALDAHALWHAATVPIAKYWYAWLIDDARECVMSGYWVGDVDSTTAKYLQIPHKTEAAVGNVGRVVGPPVRRAVERARGWVETAAGRSSDVMAATGSSSGIEFKTLTTKLNDFARGTLGNATSVPNNAPVVRSTSHVRASSASNAAAFTGNSDREREKLHELDKRGVQ